MDKGESLHQLVHSLDKAEKRNFKRFVVFNSGKKTSNVLVLFLQLLEMEKYEPALLKERLAGTPVRKQLSVCQTMLFNQILRCLRLIRRKEDLDWRIRQGLTDIEILFERKLYQECLRRINQLMALCHQYERRTALLELHRWQYKLMLSSGKVGADLFIQKEQKERHAIGLALLQDTQAEIVEAYSRVKLRKDYFRTQSGLDQELEAYIRQLDAYPPQAALNFSAWYQWTRAEANLSYVKRDFDAALQGYAVILKEMEARPDWLNLEPDIYLSVLNNFLGCCQVLKKTTLYLKKIQALPKLPITKPETLIRFQITSYSQELLYTVHFQSYEASLEVIQQIEAWISAHHSEIPISKLLVIYYNITAVYFTHDNFTGANQWLLRILNVPGKEARADIREFARMFQLVLQYELEDFELLDYLLRSTKKFLRRRGQLHTYEGLLLTLFRNMLQVSGAAQELQTWTNLMTGLQGISNDTNTANPVGINELMLWVQSKQEGRSVRASFEARRAGLGK